MLEQGYLTRPIYTQSVSEALPPKNDIQPPREDSAAPYFTTWVKQQVVDRFGAQRAFAGGLQIKTTLDLDLQQAAQRRRHREPERGRAERRARGDRQPHGRRRGDGRRAWATTTPAAVQPRHPGPAPAGVVVQALRARPGAQGGHQPRLGVGVQAEGLSHQRRQELLRRQQLQRRVQRLHHPARRDRRVRQLGVRRDRASRSARAGSPALARRMGIRTRVSSNPAVTLGGLKQGVTPLDMAHAYQTLRAPGPADLGHAGRVQARARSGSCPCATRTTR